MMAHGTVRWYCYCWAPLLASDEDPDFPAKIIGLSVGVGGRQEYVSELLHRRRRKVPGDIIVAPLRVSRDPVDMIAVRRKFRNRGI
jgi:hypothetical protein